MANLSVTQNRDIYIGGSDIREIINPAYHKSVYVFALNKLGLSGHGFNGNEYTRYGETMESKIRDYVNKALKLNFKEDCIIDDIRNFRGNLDGIDVANKKILEVKTHGEKLDIDKYIYQIQFYLYLTKKLGINSCLLVTYKRPADFDTTFDESNLQIIEIKRDDKLFQSLTPMIQRFQTALNGLRINPKMSAREFNNLLYGTKLMKKICSLSFYHRQNGKTKEELEKLEVLKTEVYEMFRERSIKQFGDNLIKITLIEPTETINVSIDEEKLKNEYPEVYEKCKVVKKTKIKGNVRLKKR